ncbi:LamG-like jellyroll fold domain-containing protein, partial [uncultured Lutibacter sp.]|uniref:LamG-like jellyroll fold domain-containing protein n=1 Tax=uncultured Lutibacter sp. TaxID=437739 RepID=UPI00344680E7
STVTWSFNDGNGQIVTQTQDIIVDDTTKPTANNLAPISVQCSADIPAPNIDEVTTEADNCTVNPTVAFVSDVSDGNFNPEVITRTYSITDASSNETLITQEIIVQDTEKPDIPILTDLTAECSLTVTPPTTTDNCDGTITGVTSGSLIFDTVGSDIIYWTFTDSAGNSVISEQEITITDDNGPVPDVSTLPALNLTGCQITSISDLPIPTATDDCDSGTILGTLGNGFVFPFIFSGTQTIDWEFIDSNGNVTFQPQDITLTPIPVSGGTLEGTFESTVFSNQIDISSCGVAISIELNLSGEIGTIVRWESYAVNHGFWEEITDADGDDTKFTVSFPIGSLESTYYRVLVQTGTCAEYSNQFYVRALPAGDAPTVERLDPDEFYCLGDEVNLLATSNYTATQESIPDDKGEGDFNQGQFPRDPDGWLVDGNVGGFTAGGSATKPRNWSAKTCNNQANGNIIYCGGEGKYAIAYGDYSDNKYRGPNPSTLETPILDFSNAESASLDFDQAYNFVNGDYAIIEISTDGGVSYSPLRLMHAVGSGDLNWYSAGTAESYVGSDPTNYNFETDNTSIDLSAYIGESNVRIRWTFSGTSNESAWAMDNIEVNKLVIVETDVEWTDGIGDPDEPPIAGGATEVPISFTPDAPGHHQYGGTALINGCRTYSEEGTALIDVYVSYAYAGEDIEFTSDECGQNTVQLNAYDNRLSANENAAKGAYTLPDDCINCDDDGTGEEGIWTISENSSCGGGSFSDPTDPDAIFTGDAGTYILTWTVNGCESNITVKITDCTQVDFDGVDDYVDFGEDNYDLNTSAFSIEVWIKPELISGTQTIFSKRDANFSGSANGYDLRIDNLGEVSFNWNKTGKIYSSHKINTDRWYHIALTHSISGEYILYIDGVLMSSIGGGSPKENGYKAILGAMDNSVSDVPLNYFNGWMDELRIWDVELTEDQLHQMMNQKIISSPDVVGNVQGEIIPVDIHGLSWTNLLGYYQMESIGCGYLNSTTNLIHGKLKNITTSETQTAPLPYTSSNNGNWNDINIWTQATLWNLPNSLGIDDKTPIDWNIVKTNHTINASRDLKLLGLLVESGELQMDGTTTLGSSSTSSGTGYGLYISHYLKLDGIIDLEGESQLIQKRYTPTQFSESILDAASSGYIERDQQGDGNKFRYNDWSSPVQQIFNGSTYSIPGNDTYNISGVLRDGTTSSNPKKITFIGGLDGQNTDPIKISNFWLYVYTNFTHDDYYSWLRAGSNSILKVGEGFLMKGTGGVGSIDQNYVFVGRPNNGNIELTVSGDNDYLIGNPYPSAIDANQFILDNKSFITGTLYFWDHYGGDSHYLLDYQAGFATYNLS